MSLSNIVAYNCWANERIIKSVLNAGAEKANMPMESSFSSIKKTLYHIYDAENTWLMRLKQLPYLWPPSQSFTGDLNEFCDFLLANSTDFLSYIESLKPPDFDKQITYNNSKGTAFSTSIHHIVIHCMNHSTYHRGQLVTMLRMAGHTQFDPLDYIAFVR